MRIYEYDVERTIHLNGSADSTSIPASSLGYLVGRCEGESLIVTTTRVNSAYLDAYGTPQSDQVSREERFTMTLDGQRLNYSMTASDPQMYTEPVTLERFWRWTLEIDLKPFDCVVWTGSTE